MRGAAGAMLWAVSSLFMLSFTGLAYVLFQALHAGAETYAVAYTADTARRLEDVFLFIPPRRILELAWTFAIAVFLLVFLLTGDLKGAPLGVTRGLVLGGLAALLALFSPSWLVRFLKTRRLHRFNLQLVEALTNMSNALKAGFTITQAFDSVVTMGQNPIAQEFQVFLQQTRVGVSFNDALAHLESRVGSEDLSLTVGAIEIARHTGGNLTEVFERIAMTIRERMRVQERIRTLTAQGRLQGIVVGLMPVVLLIVFTLIDPEMMLPFLKSWVGIAALVGVAFLEFLGAALIRRIIRIDV